MNIKIKLGLIIFCFESNKKVIESLKKYYFNFLSDKDEIDYSVEISRAKKIENSSITYKNNCLSIININEKRPEDYLNVKINFKHNSSIIYYHCITDIIQDRFKWEFYLRVAIYMFLIENQHILIHASGIVRNNSGYLFLGPSGAGKTTAARNCIKSNFKILNDDTMIIYKDKSTYYVSSTPYLSTSAISPVDGYAILKGLFVIMKSDKVTVRKESLALGLQQLYTHTFSLGFLMDMLPELKNMFTSFLRSINNNIPFFILETAINEDPIPCICNELGGEVLFRNNIIER